MTLNNRYNPASFSDEEDNGTVATPMYTDGAIVRLRFCFLPRKCSISGKRLWLTKAYKLTERYYSYTGDEMIYTWWVDKNAYLIEKLKA